MIQAFGDRFNEALDPFLGSEEHVCLGGEMEACGHERSRDDSETPSGFEPRSFAGIGMTCNFVEPTSIKSISEWEEATSDLDIMGEGSGPIISVLSLAFGERQRPDCQTRGDSNWIAEFLPWGSDGLLRQRIDSSSESMRCSLRGILLGGDDLILIWEGGDEEDSSRDVLD